MEIKQRKKKKTKKTSRCICETLMSKTWPFVFINVALIFDLHHGRKSNFLLQGIQLCNMKVLSFITYSKVMASVKSYGQCQQLWPTQVFKNYVGKGEIALNMQFLLFPQLFYFLENFLPFSSNLKLSSAKFSVRMSLKYVVRYRVNPFLHIYSF